MLKKNTAETKTGDTTNEFKAGNVIFAVNWGFAWGASQRDADSLVREKVGVTRLPRLKDGQHVSSVGVDINGRSQVFRATSRKQSNFSVT